jgi:hypothetical protein
MLHFHLLTSKLLLFHTYVSATAEKKESGGSCAREAWRIEGRQSARTKPITQRALKDREISRSGTMEF